MAEAAAAAAATGTGDGVAGTGAAGAVDTGVAGAAKGGVSNGEEKAKEGQGQETLLGKEAKVDDKAAADGKKPAAASEATEIDPGKFTLPEGFKADEKLMASFVGVLKDTKVSQEVGQKFLDLHANVIKQVSEANTKAWDTTKTAWEGEVKADKEIGGDKLTPTVQSISKLIDSFGAEGAKAFRTALDITGAGSNPAIIRGLAKLAAKLTEGGHVAGNPAKGEKSLGEVFFPNSPEMK